MVRARSGSAARPTTTRATSSAGAGTTRYITLVGDHPVIHAGAGSHAAYFEAGEYITTVPLPAFRGLRGLFDGLRHVWRDTLRQGDPGDLGARVEAALSIPFIDYARGDGRAIGPGQTAEWSVVEVDDDVPWVDGYRGLWGLDTRDRFAGERAPAGLKYTRTGSVRPSWNDPIGFLGLDKVAPPFAVVGAIDDRRAELDDEAAKLDAEIATAADGITGRDQAVKALAADGALEKAHERRAAELAAEEAELARLRARRVELDDERAALDRRRAAAVAGERGDPRAHLHHDHHPQTTGDQHYGRLVEFWSAVSVGLGLIALIALLFVVHLPIWAGIVLAVGGYLVLEAAFRRRLIDLLLRITLVLALVGAVILAVTLCRRDRRARDRRRRGPHPDRQHPRDPRELREPRHAGHRAAIRRTRGAAATRAREPGSIAAVVLGLLACVALVAHHDDRLDPPGRAEHRSVRRPDVGRRGGPGGHRLAEPPGEPAGRRRARRRGPAGDRPAGQRQAPCRADRRFGRGPPPGRARQPDADRGLPAGVGAVDPVRPPADRGDPAR